MTDEDQQKPITIAWAEYDRLTRVAAMEAARADRAFHIRPSYVCARCEYVTRERGDLIAHLRDEHNLTLDNTPCP